MTTQTDAGMAAELSLMLHSQICPDVNMRTGE